MKLVKMAAWVAGAIVVVLIAAGIAFVLLFDANSFKSRIEQAAKERTGRTLTLEGKVGISFYPSLGAAVGRAKKDRIAIGVGDGAIGGEVVGQHAFGERLLRGVRAEPDELPGGRHEIGGFLTRGRFLGMDEVSPDHHLPKIEIPLGRVRGSAELPAGVTSGEEVNELKQSVEHPKRHQQRVLQHT